MALRNCICIITGSGFHWDPFGRAAVRQLGFHLLLPERQRYTGRHPAAVVLYCLQR